MSKDILLMYRDSIVLRVNTDEGIYETIDDFHMPFQLKGKITNVPELNNSPTRYEITQATIAMNKNYQAFEHFLATRVLPLTRENADKLYTLMHQNRLDNDRDKASFALICRAASLQDNYWVKTLGDKVSWKDINLHANSLSETVANVALHGSSLTLNGRYENTPEFNAQGAYAKAWKREKDGLWLYKLGKDENDTEAKIEVMVSKLLDKCNVDHVRYYAAESHGRFASKCKCLTSEKLSILPGVDYLSYCDANGIDGSKDIFRYDPESICKMCIVDYLISNRDRHGMNWGFFYDPATMKILGCHPLLDHNNAFDKEWMNNKNAEYIFMPHLTIRRAAEIAMDKVDFHFTEQIGRGDFLTDEQYESFTERAKELGISIKRERIQTIEQIQVDQDERTDI